MAGSTHFGSMANRVQAVMVFSFAAAQSTSERTAAHSCRHRYETFLQVLIEVMHTVASDGKLSMALSAMSDGKSCTCFDVGIGVLILGVREVRCELLLTRSQFFPHEG